jgi:hypothetical protein
MAKKAFKRLRMAAPPRCPNRPFAPAAPPRGNGKLTIRRAHRMATRSTRKAIASRWLALASDARRVPFMVQRFRRIT